ncbi:hypothetical protein [Burkholderia savannae]|uniref:hypothetical protein n=1 Tax=Burkholderia savannae TaxID=1637837 RepID=UPI000A4E9A30|nr:hypothetical protein [Burkholderia savannae]
MQEKIEKTKLEGHTLEEIHQLATRERELLSQRALIRKQEHELDVYRKRLKEEQLVREQELQRELEAREKIFSERERNLIERQREFERHLMRRESETESLRTHLQNEISDREAKLQQALSDLQQEKERYSEESRKKIERTSKDYVMDALDALDKKERQFHRISKVWSFIGAASLAGGIGFFVYVTLSTTITFPPHITWEFIVFSVFKGLIAVGLLAGLAKYSFLFSSSYMQEALKNADRRHAINFGKFYLESYGAAAEWSQVKEAFEHWNIAGSNAFTRSEDAGPDVTSLEKAVSLIAHASKVLPLPKSDSA